MNLNNYRALHRQQGLSYTGFMVVFAVCVFFGLFAIKVGPHYYENWTVTKVAEDLAANPDILSQSKTKVYSYITQAYRTNNLWDTKAEDTILLEKDKKKGFIVNVQYERRANLLHNIDVVTSFSMRAN